MENKRAGYTREECCQMLLDAYISLGGYPKKSDFTPEQVGWIKSYLGPWPRALEACGILPDRSAERAEAKKHKRIASKRKMTQYKLAKHTPFTIAHAPLCVFPHQKYVHSMTF